MPDGTVVPNERVVHLGNKVVEARRAQEGYDVGDITRNEDATTGLGRCATITVAMKYCPAFSFPRREGQDYHTLLVKSPMGK